MLQLAFVTLDLSVGTKRLGLTLKCEFDVILTLDLTFPHLSFLYCPSHILIQGEEMLACFYFSFLT